MRQGLFQARLLRFLTNHSASSHLHSWDGFAYPYLSISCLTSRLVLVLQTSSLWRKVIIKIILFYPKPIWVQSLSDSAFPEAWSMQWKAPYPWEEDLKASRSTCFWVFINCSPGVFKVAPACSASEGSSHQVWQTCKGSKDLCVLENFDLRTVLYINSWFGQIYFKADNYMFIYIFLCVFEISTDVTGWESEEDTHTEN